MRAVLTTVLEVAGYATVAVGVGMMLVPAGVVVGGAALVWVAYGLSAGGRK